MFSTNLNNPVTPVYLPLWIGSGGADYRALILHNLY